VSKEDWAHSDREWRNCKRAILAYHVGGWRRGESPLEALARALGVEPRDILLELTDPWTARCELDELSACLGAGWIEPPGIDIGESIVLAISILNEKLEDVPPEVRAFFGAPRKLEPFLPTRRLLFGARDAIGARA
jgi:hypothetical protein